MNRPSWFLYATEGIRASIELLQCLWFFAFYPFKKVGDNRPIVVVPGLITSDRSTFWLRWFLKKNGYTNVQGWNLGTNLGRLEKLPKLAENIQALYQSHQQAVTLIGWSLGGVFIREVAKQNPQIISQLITMGSPFAGLDAPNHAKRVYEFFNHSQAIDPQLWEQIPTPAPVPTTALYSKQDGIVPWQACMEQETATHQNIQVHSSHVGLGVNVEVLKILLEKLR